MEESQKCSATSKKADTEDYMLCASIYLKCPEKATLQRQKHTSSCLGLGLGVHHFYRQT